MCELNNWEDIWDTFEEVIVLHWQSWNRSEEDRFNIITSNDEINDMNDNTMNCHNNNPTNVVYSNINYKNVQQERTAHDSLYRPADYKLQLNYNVEELYRMDDWRSTNSHKVELVITYDTKVGYKTL